MAAIDGGVCGFVDASGDPWLATNLPNFAGDASNRAQPCHYISFTQNHVIWLPLVAAVARVIGAERNQKQLPAKTLTSRAQIQTLEKIVQISRRIILQSEENPAKGPMLEKVHYLEEAKKNLQRRQQNLISCLGKRKLGQDVAQHHQGEVGNLSTSQAIVQVQGWSESTRGILPCRLKTVGRVYQDGYAD
jgi:hypothetical protein